MGYFARGDRIGDWEVSRRVGRGGMGVVYAATHAVIGKRAAVKVIRAELRHEPALAARFVHEARVVNRIAHPGVVDIFQAGRLDDGRVYLVMEFLMGRSLGAILRDGRPPPALAIAILQALCAPLACAHAHGVVHRDLKPDNIFVDEPGGIARVKLLDWGLSTTTDEHQPAETCLIGTPRYIAPEQACGRRVDDRADVYALGVVAYELLCGRVPFESAELPDLVRMHLHAAPPPPRAWWSSIPGELDDLLIAMLAKDPARRPSIACVHATLARVASPSGARTSPSEALRAAS